MWCSLLMEFDQFGMDHDQLHDSPTEDSILYVHWYVWIYYTCSLIAQITTNLLFCDSVFLDVVDSL